MSRQSLAVYPKEDSNWQENINRGAYLVKDCAGSPEIVLIATGSEVNLALEVRELLSHKKVRVISMLSRELFSASPGEYREKLIPKDAFRAVLEAGVSSGWEGIAAGGSGGLILSIDRFGESGPAKALTEYFGFTAEDIADKIDKEL